MNEKRNPFLDNKYIRQQVKDAMVTYEMDGLSKATMVGVYDDLMALKPIIEELYSSKIEDLDRWTDDAPYFGWSWKYHNESMKNMLEIDKRIQDKFIEIYALILIGLGEEIEEDKLNA